MFGCIRVVRATPGQSIPGRARLPSYQDMLKHKLRKSRKNILHLLEFHEEHEKRAAIPEYSEIKKTGRKDKKKKGKNPNINCTYRVIDWKLITNFSLEMFSLLKLL